MLEKYRSFSGERDVSELASKMKNGECCGTSWDGAGKSCGTLTIALLSLLSVGSLIGETSVII